MRKKGTFSARCSQNTQIWKNVKNTKKRFTQCIPLFSCLLYILENCKNYGKTVNNIDIRIDDADVRKKSKESTSHSEFANFVANMIKTEYPFVDAVVMVYDDLSGIYWHAGHYMVYRWRRDGKNLRISDLSTILLQRYQI